MSRKEATRPPKFDEKPAEDRKMQELYGNSGYAPVGKGPKPAKETTGDNHRDRKANHLQS